jgi:hypothetical protein
MPTNYNSLLMGPQAADDPYSAWHNIQALFGQGPYAAPPPLPMPPRPAVPQSPTTRSVPAVKIRVSQVNPDGTPAARKSAYDPTGDASTYQMLDDMLSDQTQFPSAGLPRTTIASGTTYYPQNGVGYGYNARTGAYEPIQRGESYTVTPPLKNGSLDAYVSGKRPKTTPAVAAIDRQTAPKPISSAFRGGWGSSLFNTEPNGMPIDSDVPLNVPHRAVPTVPVRAPWTPGTPLEDVIDPQYKQNDVLANIGTRLGDTPAGHIASLLTGGIPQSGILNMLFPNGLGGPRQTAGAPSVAAPRPAPVQGPGPNGSAGQGTIYNNPTKYGATQADRNAAADKRQAFLASWNSA